MDNNTDYMNRFHGISRLVGKKAFQTLKEKHVAVIGIGGVGSWIAESLVRSGIQKITLIDLDDICTSNINRQVHALDSTTGQLKTEVMKKRLLDINPNAQITEIQSFFSKKNAQDILGNNYDYIVDAIDSFDAKILLITECKKREVPLMVCGGAGGRIDPTKLKIDDLSKSYNDKLLQRVRKCLKQKHNFPREKKFKIPCVFSFERAVYPKEDGEVCHTVTLKDPSLQNCQTGFGSASFVTAPMAFFAASYVIRELSSY